ncbi:unnamed protein product [Rhodiola kirilowii]
MAMLTLTEANLLLIPKGQTSLQDRVVSADSKREAVDLLPKASGYLKFCIEDILVHIPADIRLRLWWPLSMAKLPVFRSFFKLKPI